MSSEMGKVVTIATLQQMRQQAHKHMGHSHFYMYTLQKVHLDLSLKILLKCTEEKSLGNFL